MSNKVLDFIEGQKDCADGKPAKQGASEDYNRGYGAEYERQQAKDWETRNAY